jgi:hypothetical protein
MRAIGAALTTRADAWDHPGWKEAAEQYRRDCAGRALIVEIEPERLKRLRRCLIEPSMTLEQAWNEINKLQNRATPSVTVETVMLVVRSRRLAALKEGVTVERLERCDAVARAEINQRIQKLGLK